MQVCLGAMQVADGRGGHDGGDVDGVSTTVGTRGSDGGGRRRARGDRSVARKFRGESAARNPKRRLFLSMLSWTQRRCAPPPHCKSLSEEFPATDSEPSEDSSPEEDAVDDDVPQINVNAVRKRLTLQLEMMSFEQLQAECRRQGAMDLLYNRTLKDRASLKAALLDALLAPWEVNDDEPETIDAWLACTADPWPVCEARAVPKEDHEVLDPLGPWSLDACGVEIKLCDDESKGKGAFAVRPIEQGHVAGVYVGERLDQRMHSLRHAERGPLFVPPSASESAKLAERQRRLEKLDPASGAPMGGVHNGGSYCFTVLPDVHSQIFPGRTAFIDAEDPTRSSWARYVNHAAEKQGMACNLEPKVDGLRGLAWLEARRRIEPGEELCFDYGEAYWTAQQRRHLHA